MSTLKADAVTSKSDNTDLTITGGGTGVPNLEAGFKVGGTVGVPTASIRDDAVTLAKIAAGTDGELITWDASGDPAVVAVGTSTHVLTSNGAGSAPTFQAAGGGAWNLISVITASNAASVDFDSGLSSTYKNYVVIATNIIAATNGSWMWARVSTDGGSNWDDGASDYQWQQSGVNSGAVRTSSDYADNQMVIGTNAAYTGVGNATATNCILQLRIGNPSGTSNYKTCVWEFGGTSYSTGDEPFYMFGAGYRDATAAVDSIQFLMSSGNISGIFNLYGLADS